MLRLSHSAFYTTPLNTAAAIGGTILRLPRRSLPVRQITHGNNGPTRQPQPVRTGQNHPSRPTRPGAHQNQIHNTKEQTHGHNPAHPTLSEARQSQPIEDPSHETAIAAAGRRPAPRRGQSSPSPLHPKGDRRPLHPCSRAEPRYAGGDYRIRTDDPLLAKQVLYQLS